MLTHIVVWKYRADVSQETRDQHVTLLRNLAGIIREVRSLSVGYDVLKLPRSYDTGLWRSLMTERDSMPTQFTLSM